MAQTMEKASGDEWFLDGLDRHLHTAAKVIKLVYAATACFAVAVFSYYIIVLQSQATVYLDVNPSVQFELNSRDEVVVFDQDVYVDDELKAMAEQYKITPGKAELIRKLTSENPKLNYAELAVLPIKNLIERLNQEGIDLREYANYTGSGYNLETEEKDDSEDCNSEISYKYDDKGNYKKIENVCDDVWFVEKYDKLGILLETISDCGLRYDGVYGVDINQISKTIYNYDRGNKISEESYIEEIEYDEGWSCHYKTGEWILTGKKEYKYDDLGNLTEEITFEGEASLFQEGLIYEYEYYDESSNIKNDMYWKKCDIKTITISDKNFVRISNPSKNKKDMYWVYLSKSTYDKLEKGDDFDEVLEQYDLDTRKFLAIGKIPKKNGKIIRKVFVTRAVAQSVAYYAWLYIQHFDCDASDEMKGKDANSLVDEFLEKSNRYLNLYISLRKNLDEFLSEFSEEDIQKYFSVKDIIGAKQKFNRIIYHTYLDCQFMRSDYDKEEDFHKNTGVFYEKNVLEGTDVYYLDEPYLKELGMRECEACNKKVEVKPSQIKL